MITTTKSQRGGFSPLFYQGLTNRLIREICDAAHELALRPGSYLHHAFLPDPLCEWLPVKLVRETQHAVSTYITDPYASFRVLWSLGKTRRRFIAILILSILLHLVIIWLASLLPPLGLLVKEDSAFDFKPWIKLVPIGLSRGLTKGYMTHQSGGPDLMKVRDRSKPQSTQTVQATPRPIAAIVPPSPTPDQARIAELAREMVEKAKRVSETPLKRALEHAYTTYVTSGEKELGVFYLTAAFNIEPDGTLSQIKLVQPSGIPTIDDQVPLFLEAISESRALGIFPVLTATSLHLQVSEGEVELTLSGTAEQALDAQVSSLALAAVRLLTSFNTKNPDIKVLLGGLAANNDGTQLVVRLRLPRARTAEMMRANFRPCRYRVDCQYPQVNFVENRFISAHQVWLRE